MAGNWGGARAGAGRPSTELTREQMMRRDLAHAALGGLGPASWLKAPDGAIAITDEELADHWHRWARDSHAWGQAGWDATTYAYWRFVRRVSVDEAVAAADAENVRRHGFPSAPAALAWAARDGRQAPASV